MNNENDWRDRGMPPSNHELDKRLALTEAAVVVMEKQLTQINTSLSRLVWAVLAGIGTALMNFVFRGGLGP